MGEQKISAATRLQNFNMNTVKYIHPIASYTVGTTENAQKQFILPKSRLLSSIIVEITGVLTATHASETTYTPHEDGIFNFIKNIKLDTNQGFIPYNITGKTLYLENVSQFGKLAMANSATSTARARSILGVTSSSGGTANTFKIYAELNPMINKRDGIGLINLSYPESNVALDINLGAASDIAPASTGYTFAISSVVINVTAVTFSIPNNPINVPPLNTFKLVNEISDSVIAGQNTIKMACGQTIRKLFLQVYDSTPDRIADSGITSNFELILNQADTPIIISPRQLALENFTTYDSALSAGQWIFDFASVGALRNLAGTRDLINTSRLKEFWLRFTTSAAGTYRLGIESLATIG